MKQSEGQPPPRITVPEPIANLPLVVNVSGGKDSAALVLALREAGIAVHSYVFADTGWEHPATLAHIETIERTLGIAVARVGVPGGMLALARHRASFPSRAQRWCTSELKIEPINEHLKAVAAATGQDTVSVIGVRADESAARARQPPLEWESRDFGRFVWRPIQSWTIEQVIGAHRRAGLALNPLYHAGFNRVGCYPCINSQKAEIRLLAERSPERIEEIAQLEQEFTALRVERNAVRPGRYAHEHAPFFSSRDPGTIMSIRDVALWARTTHGGRQLPLLPEPPEGGCLQWGLCEPPPPGEDTQ